APTGDDEGFNGIIVRTPTGEDLVRSAVEAGALVLGRPIDPREFDELQPHQVRKKEALASRFAGLAEAGISTISTTGLRVDLLGSRLHPEARLAEQAGTLRRATEGRFTGPLPVPPIDQPTDHA
ncbi:MAG: coenzyme F420 hydrogenase, partial [Actinomycetota bacterium]|nr:coenzyme F420 hydrogenase [Actinomycetota bacterium]